MKCIFIIVIPQNTYQELFCWSYSQKLFQVEQKVLRCQFPRSRKSILIINFISKNHRDLVQMVISNHRLKWIVLVNLFELENNCAVICTRVLVSDMYFYYWTSTFQVFVSKVLRYWVAYDFRDIIQNQIGAIQIHWGLITLH